MRTFIAIDLPKAVKTEICSLGNNIPPDSARIKWVRKENIHLTLVFLGEISEQQLEAVKLACQVVSRKHKTFQMSIQKSGVFPNTKKPRIVWVGISQGEVKIVHSLVSDIIKELNFSLLDKRKDFNPHITLGRVKSIYNGVALKKSIESLIIETDRFLVREIILFKSVLCPGGAVYTPLKKFPLQPKGILNKSKNQDPY